ncbi:MAG: mannose-1-phosphate guanylyltransferase/mannose-6-phosphate isomerase [Gammaproteobacteria bacterium]|nr:mannose-1-phosphate guanylyltransferase/mannose-6-phosphate isomerase [Gammaproteobacteria bacterium]
MITPVILCGGSGTRLWPLSRPAYPKQFLDLTGSGSSMLQQTVQRLTGLPRLGGALFVCNNENRFLVAQQMQDISASVDAILLEPAARNTAPAVCCAALHALQNDSEATLLVLPADHLVADAHALQQALLLAEQAANQDYLVTFGVVPDQPETGYGYIRKSGDTGVAGASEIAEFVEKPDLATAQAYLADGSYLWNSGMFMFRAARYIEEIGARAPDILAACEKAVAASRRDLDFTCLDADAFASCPSDSIDYAVMEKSARRAVVDLDAGWSDVGSWSSLHEVQPADGNGNVAVGDVLAIETNNSYLHSEHRLLATLGVQDLVVVETADAVLVADRNKVQDVKKIVSQLQASGRGEGDTHKIVYRPWGSYETISLADRFQVKKIIVSPGHKLSLQKHHHRAEHWVVVSGTAQVTCGDKVFTLSEDESTYIPLGHKHRLENIGKIPLELIEVQSGSYLGEDDIVRYDDVYGREH